jgi:hypothetical protein
MADEACRVCGVDAYAAEDGGVVGGYAGGIVGFRWGEGKSMCCARGSTADVIVV